jgi:membrane-associated phospholipid phosphatase
MENIMKSFMKRYSHAWIVIAYVCVYAPWFFYIEKHITKNYHLIHMSLDDHIPFVEIFVVPYFLWFLYVSLTLVYFLFMNKKDYFRLCFFLFIGMTIFLIVSTVFPNGHHLRPTVFPRDNIFTHLIASLYQTDTSTNIFPSIHVFNSLGTHFAIMNSEKLVTKKWLRRGSFVLCVSIILSTVFIKQHSVFDVITGIIMAIVFYMIVYYFDFSAYLERNQKKVHPEHTI